MLYIRMLFSMVVSLYTARIVINTLGIEDYGIYNVVGGVVTMFGFLSASMTSATQRFLNFELGKGNFLQLRRVFSMSLNIHFVIAIAIFVLAETIGLWFLNTQLTIPAERMLAANWVYQFSIFSFIININTVPYNAAIIAHERMTVYAYLGILEVLLKLVIVFLLQWFGNDKLTFYAFLLFAVTLFTRVLYILYSLKKFPETKYFFFWDSDLFKTLMSFSGWNLWGNMAAVSFNQGVNILLNIFFGPPVNAARGIAYSIKGAVSGFVQNFQIALNPQIVKSFAGGDLRYMHQLIFQGAKYSFFLLFILTLPVLLETEMILKLWLKIVPDYAVIFTRLVLINILIDSVSGPLMTAAQASGKIKLYQTVVGGLLLLILPVSYLFLKLGFPPQATLYISITVSVIALYIRLLILRNLVEIKVKDFFQKVLVKSFIVGGFSILIPLFFCFQIDDSIIRFFVVIFSAIISALISIVLLGLNQNEKTFIFQALNNARKRLLK